MAITDAAPTLASWATPEALQRLFKRFYERVPGDPVIGPVFAQMDPHHAQHVAAFVTEVLGGARAYSESGGGHAHMIRRHMGRHLTQEQRKTWLRLLLDTADEVGLADDPEFRASFTGYLEWGSRIAVMNAAEGAQEPDDALPMPAWTWASPGGPYKP